MAQQGKKVLMVIAPKDFRDEEYREPRRILESKGCAITVASTHTRPAKGMLGLMVTPDATLDQVRAADFDLVVFVGGYGAEAYYDDPKAQRLASEAAGAGRLIGAICVAPTILANAGVLKGKKATVWESQSGVLASKGATYTKAAVLRDASIITADGPTSAVQFGEELARALGV
jgi:protease I